ncbi:hypothetical protein [uncultured Gemmiger sp.]|uniref:hypothetical protein n=1 Tax=uncultured Gemmiger sp. TaxID=1623490 RepID=UPI0025EFD49B|nr:hypothetical protein [uncultured Gemmiger sp.]
MTDTLSAAQFLSMRPQYKNQQAEGEIPAAVEHLFAQGTMIDHYFVTISPELAAEIAAVPCFARAAGQINGIDFCQQEDGPWLVHFREPKMVEDLCIEMPDSEFRTMLAANRIVLPGEG